MKKGEIKKKISGIINQRFSPREQQIIIEKVLNKKSKIEQKKTKILES